jgi:ABC-type lipoprotein export system ATPase subunit
VKNEGRANGEPILRAENVRRSFGDVRALDDVSLVVDAGEMVAIVGPSGSGKSTLLHVLGLLDEPTSGRVVFEGEDPARLSRDRRASLRLARIGFVFQQHNLFAHMSARENAALPAWHFGGSRNRALEKADALLADLGLAERADAPASKLSVGEMQRVAIARALVNGPAVVLADEPTGSLDRANAEVVMRALSRVAERGTALVVVTHDEGVAALARRCVQLSR